MTPEQRQKWEDWFANHDDLIFEADGEQYMGLDNFLEAISLAQEEGHMHGVKKFIDDCYPTCTCHDGYKSRTLTDPSCFRCDLLQAYGCVNENEKDECPDTFISYNGD